MVFQGTSADQDNRFSDKEKKLLKQMKFEEVLHTKVEMRRVKLDVLKPWITRRVCDFLGIEDDVVVEFIFNQLEDKNPDPRKMQINLTGFLNGKNARLFMGELWTMLDSAQNNESGIPQVLLDEKKEELRSRRVSLRQLCSRQANEMNTFNKCSVSFRARATESRRTFAAWRRATKAGDPGTVAGTGTETVAPAAGTGTETGIGAEAGRGAGAGAGTGTGTEAPGKGGREKEREAKTTSQRGIEIGSYLPQLCTSTNNVID